MLKITDIRTENLREPLGVDTAAPLFSWIAESDLNDTFQMSARICVRTDGENVWDSGEISCFGYEPVRYAGKPLSPKTRYEITVFIKDNHGQSADGSSFFETGLMRNFVGAWITYLRKPQGVPIFSRNFNVVKKVKRARLYMSALGVYEAELNGKRVGEHILAPGWTSYLHRLEYQTYDVTGLLKRRNRIEVKVAPGWFSGEVGYFHRREHYGSKNAVWANLYVFYEDGTVGRIFTDTDWSVTTKEVVSAELYDGEIIDKTRKESRGVPAVTMEFPFEVLVSQECEPVRIVERIKPVRTLRSPDGKTILDFGKNLTGFVEARLQGEKGQKVILRHGEVLDQTGALYTQNLRGIKAEDVFICSGREDVFLPTLTFHGFRYVELDGDENLLGEENYTACVIRTDYEITGNFFCSDPLLNKLYRNIQNGQAGNFVDIPTDCPQRDERLGWTGDAQVFCATAMFNGDVESFFRKWLRDVDAETTIAKGVPHTVPDIIAKYPQDGNVGIVNKEGAAAWGDAATVIPWTLYDVYGDKQLLAEQYPLMKKWVEFIRSRAGEKNLWQSGFQYGDWLALDGGRDTPSNCIGGTDVYLVASAYYAYSVQLLAKAARVLGKPEADEYERLHDKVVEAFQTEYVTPNGRLVSETQTAYVLALRFHLADGHRAKIAEMLAENIRRHGNHLTTGFVGTPCLLQVLSENGYHDLAGKLILQEDYPSWLYQVKMGATTVWERWNAMLPDGSIPDTGMTSFNHYAYGAVGEWLVQKIGGIAPLEAGYRKIRIAPMPIKGVTRAETIYTSRYGKIGCAWEWKDGVLHITAEIPMNTTAEILFTDTGEKIDVTNGIFSFERKFIYKDFL